MARAAADSLKTPQVAVLRHWVKERLGDVRHERQVSRLAAELVRATDSLHSLARSDLRLLKMAALAHDVGRCISDKEHPAIGSRMIQEDQTLPLKKRQRRALSYLTQHHRGEVPGPGEDCVLRPTDDVHQMRLLLAFLRAADALDSRSLPAPSPRIQIQLQGRDLRITCRLPKESRKARRVFSRRKKFRLLEQLLDCNVQVQLKTDRELQLPSFATTT